MWSSYRDKKAATATITASFWNSEGCSWKSPNRYHDRAPLTSSPRGLNTTIRAKSPAT